MSDKVDMGGLMAILEDVLKRMEDQGHTDKPEYEELKKQLEDIKSGKL
jgi:hypothetical protein